MSEVREAGPVRGHPSIAGKLDKADWPTWAEIDEVARAYEGNPLMAKILRAAHGGMTHGPQGLRLLYDIRHAMGFNDLHGLSQLAGDIAELRNQSGETKMTTYRVECAGYEIWGLVSVEAVQNWIDQLKAKNNIKGEQVRVYRFINGVRKGGTPDRVGVVS